MKTHTHTQEDDYLRPARNYQKMKNTVFLLFKGVIKREICDTLEGPR